jgi:hypothetical protein
MYTGTHIVELIIFHNLDMLFEFLGKFGYGYMYARGGGGIYPSWIVM